MTPRPPPTPPPTESHLDSVASPAALPHALASMSWMASNVVRLDPAEVDNALAGFLAWATSHRSELRECRSPSVEALNFSLQALCATYNLRVPVNTPRELVSGPSLDSRDSSAMLLSILRCLLVVDANVRFWYRSGGLEVLSQLVNALGDDSVEYDDQESIGILSVLGQVCTNVAVVDLLRRTNGGHIFWRAPVGLIVASEQPAVMEASLRVLKTAVGSSEIVLEDLTRLSTTLIPAMLKILNSAGGQRQVPESLLVASVTLLRSLVRDSACTEVTLSQDGLETLCDVLDWAESDSELRAMTLATLRGMASSSPQVQKQLQATGSLNELELTYPAY